MLATFRSHSQTFRAENDGQSCESEPIIDLTSAVFAQDLSDLLGLWNREDSAHSVHPRFRVQLAQFMPDVLGEMLAKQAVAAKKEHKGQFAYGQVPFSTSSTSFLSF